MPDILPITLFDTYQKKEVVISPDSTVEQGVFKLYSCGPTVYSTQHIGNMRAAWFGDTLTKVVKLAGWKVDWVLNITDVGHLVSDGDSGEDKIEIGARKEGKNAEEVVNFYLNDYLEQAKSIGLNLPQGKKRPKATQYISEQMILALELLKEGKAYLLQDGIYYDSEANRATLEEIEKEPGMSKTDGDNKFTGREIENIQKNSGDFAIWKFVDENSLQKWRFADFPEALIILEQTTNDKLASLKTGDVLIAKWGCPGWHSECVTMISEIIGKKRFSEKKFSFANKISSEFEIDLHTGGIEHIPIHHKNEILQSEALGFHLSKHWVHFEHLLVDGGKMSKSLGNTYTVHDIIKKGFDPLAFKLMLFEHNYQDQMNFTWEKLEQSQARLFNLRKEAAKIRSIYHGDWGKYSEDFYSDKDSQIKKSYKFWMDDLIANLNTSEFVNFYQYELQDYSNQLSKNQTDCDLSKRYLLWKFDEELLDLALFPQTGASQKILKKLIPDKKIQLNSRIKAIGEERYLQKMDKNWAKADEFRKLVADQGWQIDDYAWGWGVWWNPTLIKGLD